jgi:hypothetical protein
VHGSFEQLPPSGTHVPQLSLQHTCPTLHVLGPHIALSGAAGAPQADEQVSPGLAQMAQFQLQQY